MKTFSEIKKEIKKSKDKQFFSIKLAVLADSASQLFCQAVKGYGCTRQVDFDIWEAEYDQIYQTIMDESSDLYKKVPDFVIIFQSQKKLLDKFYKLNFQDRCHFADNHLQFVELLINTLNSRLKCQVIYLNFAELNDAVFGNYANKLENSFLYQLRKINFGLMQQGVRHLNFNICDVNTIQNMLGQQQFSSDKLYVNTDTIFDLDALVWVGKSITDIILAYTGKFKKCLIVDLDNTIWGGVIGDDGLENIQIGNLGIGKAFTEFQKWIKQLKERGIIVCVCSKNTEAIAKEPFERHPDMELRLNDISVFAANWETKVDNIRYIQSVLNIGFDSMVFLDDNPFEREIVRTNIPGLSVPDLPEDPAEYLTFLRQQNLFETASFTEEDQKRTLQYQQEARRTVLQKTFTNEAEFLSSLEMVAIIKPVDKFSMPRAAQLTQRSNQFNLRTVRYTESEMESIIADPAQYTYAVTLADKFGDYGLISLLIIKKQDEHTAFIDTWIMSCRVLKRGVEYFVLNEVVADLKAKGVTELIGEYLPTPKNGLVKDHYSALGFSCHQNLWRLNLSSYIPKEVFILKKECLKADPV